MDIKNFCGRVELLLGILVDISYFGGNFAHFITDHSPFNRLSSFIQLLILKMR